MGCVKPFRHPEQLHGGIHQRDWLEDLWFPSPSGTLCGREPVLPGASGQRGTAPGRCMARTAPPEPRNLRLHAGIRERGQGAEAWHTAAAGGGKGSVPRGRCQDLGQQRKKGAAAKGAGAPTLPPFPPALPARPRMRQPPLRPC